MNSLGDLRRSLDEHATFSPDHLDPTALRGRIRSARRRRDAAVGALAVTAVLAAVGAATVPAMLQDSSAPGPAAAPAVPGLSRTIDVLGLTYEYVDVVSTEGTELVVEPAWDGSDRDRVTTPPVLTWRAGSPDATVQVHDSENTLVWSSRRSDFDDHVALDDVAFGPFTVTSDVPGLEVAVFAFDPHGHVSGVADRGVVFPQRLGGQTLEAARIGSPGASSVRVGSGDATPGSNLTVSWVCSGDDPDLGLELTWPGAGSYVTTCDTASGVVRTTTGSLEDVALTAGGELSARVVRSTTDTSPVESFRGVVAAAVYSAGDTVDFDGFVEDVEFDARGHRWRLEATEPGAASKGVHVFLEPEQQWMVSAGIAAMLDEADGAVANTPVRLAYDGKPQAETSSVRRTARTVSVPPQVVPAGTEMAELRGVDDRAADSSVIRAWRRVD